MTKKDLDNWMMYHEIHKMKRQGCPMSKIQQALGLNYRTVKNYLSMSEDDYFRFLESQNQRYKRLTPYEEFVRGKLETFPVTRAAQMHDWLKEHYPDFPLVCPKTVFNFVLFVRQKYNIAQQYTSRDFFPVEELAYGFQAQVDFGEYILRTRSGSRKKVYFFSMVLSRSRQKFLCFQAQPFTAQTAVEAHEKAFAYFQGVPLQIVYDQDKVFLHDENKGDLILTKEFKAYATLRGFQLHFCRKADPQSKGKIENVIRYIKQNFLYNRVFIDIETLNDQGMSWLSRTANVMVHHRTHKVPFSEWQIEKYHLKPFVPIPVVIDSYKTYNVLKDNTIRYRGNLYTLPKGTYQGKGTSVLVRTQEDMLHIYDKDKTQILSYTISLQKGELVSNTDHRRDKSHKILEMIDELSGEFEQSGQVNRYLLKVRESKPRYSRDHLSMFRKLLEEHGRDILLEAVRYCLTNEIYSVSDLKSVILNVFKNTAKEPTDHIKLLPSSKESLEKAAIQPEKSKIDTYEKITFN
jgi:transposase